MLARLSSKIGENRPIGTSAAKPERGRQAEQEPASSGQREEDHEQREQIDQVTALAVTDLSGHDCRLGE